MHFVCSVRLIRITIFFFCLPLFIQAQPGTSNEGMKYVLPREYPVAARLGDLEEFGGSTKKVSLTEIYLKALTRNPVRYQMLPQGTEVYVGERREMPYFIETFKSIVPASIWKVRISEREKPRLKKQNFSSKLLEQEFIYLLHYAYDSVEISKEEQIYLDSLRREREKEAKAAALQSLKDQLVAHARSGNQRALLELLEKYPTLGVNVLDSQGISPLSAAIQAERIHVVRLLMSRKADSDYPNRDGTTPLQLARKVPEKRILYLVYTYRDR